MTPTAFLEQISASIAEYPVVAVLAAVAGGLFSTSVCPCTVPGGIGLAGYIGAGAAADSSGMRRERWSHAATAVAFSLGLAGALGVLGTLAAVLGRVAQRWDSVFSLAAAASTLVAALAAFAGPALRRHVPDLHMRQRSGLAGAVVYGILFSVVTITSSAAPLLLVLTLAAAVGHPWYGFVLSLAYGVGRALPFLLVGVFAGRVVGWLGGLDRRRRTVEVMSGIALLGMSVYFVHLSAVLRR